MKAALAILLALAFPLAAAESTSPLASPSGKLHLRLGDSTPLPGAIMPVQEREGVEGKQTLVLEEKGRPPFVITAPDGRCTPQWSADESYLALAIQTDRANFSLLILRLSDRSSITCDFTALGQQMLELFQKAGLDAAAAALQLRSVRCTPQQCTGTLVSGTAQHTGTLTFAIDLPQQDWTPTGTLVLPRLTASELKVKD
ncbi:MAG: hypothetical protein NTY98_02660 [Verrucomicrobia bacterium]|nr:hypothetical protein [Verrucomicrobiota bacterium]